MGVLSNSIHSCRQLTQSVSSHAWCADSAIEITDYALPSSGLWSMQPLSFSPKLNPRRKPLWTRMAWLPRHQPPSSPCSWSWSIYVWALGDSTKIILWTWI